MPSIIFPLWLRRATPPEYIRAAARTAADLPQAYCSLDLVAVLDDLVPFVLMDLPVGEQRLRRRRYTEYCISAGFDQCVFASDLRLDMAHLLPCVSRLTWSDFKAALPAYKRTDLLNYSLEELGVFFGQTVLILEAAKELDARVILHGPAWHQYAMLLSELLGRETCFVEFGRLDEAEVVRRDDGYLPGGTEGSTVIAPEAPCEPTVVRYA